MKNVCSLLYFWSADWTTVALTTAETTESPLTTAETTAAVLTTNTSTTAALTTDDLITSESNVASWTTEVTSNQSTSIDLINAEAAETAGTLYDCADKWVFS